MKQPTLAETGKGIAIGAMIVAAIVTAYVTLPEHPNKEINESRYNELQTWWGEYPQARQDIFNAMSSDIMITHSEYQSIKEKVMALKFKKTKNTLYEKAISE